MDVKSLQRFTGYVLYGVDLKDLLERVVAYANGCQKLVFDSSLANLAREVCGGSADLERLESPEDVARHLARGKLVVIPVEPPASGVSSIALLTGLRKRS